MLLSEISPSMMCADEDGLSVLLDMFEENGIEHLHMDIMDGVFVNNFTLGTDDCRRMRRRTAIPLDLHLMITEPEKKLAWFDIQPGEMVSVHVEATCHLQKALAEIRARGAHPVAALNPATPLSVLDYVLDDLDGVLIMTVNPGFAGQKLIPATLGKIADCRRYLDDRGYGHVRIEVDGNVSIPNAEKMRAAGADIFVAGTSSIFCDGDMGENIGRFREAIR
ncbi:MAG: ribulose-phosphate 3-epimerase [Clostridia bacterium]|nr:ribulose-phosphate 3-epimerase [Clostridia bacterium]